MDELEYIPIEQTLQRQHIRLEIIVDQDGHLDIRPIDEPTVIAVATADSVKMESPVREGG